MTRPKLSICIPTYNRAPLLRSLLQQLVQDLDRLPFATEVVVADNASEDETQTVLEEFAPLLPLRHMRHETNIGAVANVQHVTRMAEGDYALYLADDDRLVPSGVVAAIDLLEEHPQAAALYAPWSMVDLHDRRDLGQFYQQPDTVVIARGDYSHLAEHVAAHAIFSEISILRTDVVRRIRPLMNDLAFWGFAFPCEYIAVGDLIYAHRPFYASITRHDAGAPREQVGNTEVLSAWDRYRGGLEHMLGLALAHGGMRAPDRVRQQMETMVVDRQLVALRLRLIAGRDPLESYYLATRLRGLGRVTDLPLPLDQIRLAAAVRYVTSELPQMTGADRLVVLGECPAETLANLVRGADRPVEQITDESDLKPSDALLVLGEASEDHLASLETRCAAAMSEAELFRKFP